MANKAKKALAFAMAALMMVGVMSGCSSSSGESSTGGSSSAAEGSSSTEGSSEASGESIELVYYCNPTKNNDNPDIAAAFTKENPGITVQLVELPTDTNKKNQTLSTVLQAQDSSMDVFNIDCTWPQMYAAAGWVEPLDDVLTEEEKAAYLEGPIEANTVNGVLYSLPQYIDVGVLYYRTDLLEKYNYEPPKTWDELREQAKTIVAGEPGMSGFVSAWKSYEGLVCCATDMILSYGGQVVDDEGKVVINSAETAEALQVMHDMIWVDKITEAGITGYMWADAQVPFCSGSVVFMRDWPSAWSAIQNPENSVVSDKAAFTQLPSGPAGSYSSLGGWSVAVSPYSEHKDEAKQLAKFISGAEAMKIRAIYNNNLPARPDVYEDAEVLEARPEMELLVSCAETARSRPKSAYYEELSAVLQQGISSILADSTDVQTALNDMTTQLEEIVSR